MGIPAGTQNPYISIPAKSSKKAKFKKKKKKRKFDQIIKKKIQANHQQKDYQQLNQHYQQANPKTNCKSYRLRSYRYVAAKENIILI